MAEDNTVRSARAEALAARETARWTRRYAQTRTLPVLVGVGVTGALFVSVFLGFIGLGWASRNHHLALFWGLAVGVVMAYGLLLWVSVPRWGGRRLQAVASKCYEAEGSVRMPDVASARVMKTAAKVAAGLFACAVLTQVALGVMGYLPMEQMLPVSALYMVPFTVFTSVMLRSYPLLLFPVLYGLHAFLLTVGVPLHFTPSPAADFLIAVLGYQMLASLAGHAYNRYALTRLQAAGRVALDGEEGV